MRFTDGHRWWEYRGHSYYGLGTSLCYRHDWWLNHKFPLQHIEEDANFVAEAYVNQQYIAAEAGDLMYATIHPGNTSPREMVGNLWVEL